MQRMALCFFILLFFGSCTPKIFQGLASSGIKRIEKSDLHPFVVDTVLMYNIKIDHGNTYFIGILLIKPVGNHAIRTLFTSTSGLTIFDFELSESAFTVNYCFPPLQEQRILNMFKKDFRALFSCHLPQSVEAEVYEKELAPVGYKIKTADGKAYFLTQDRQLKKIEMPAFITSLKIDYQTYKNNRPERILIAHPSLKFTMQLEKMEQ